jgi:hypothetical protein
VNVSAASAVFLVLLVGSALLVVVVGTSDRPRPAWRLPEGEPTPKGDVRGDARNRGAARGRRERRERRGRARSERAATAEPAAAEPRASAEASPQTAGPAPDAVAEASPRTARPGPDAVAEASPQTAGPGPGASAEPSPRVAVTRFYATLDDRRFGVAWRTLSPAVRSAFGGFGAWRAGYATTISSRPSALRVSPAPGGATVEHVLTAADRTPCGPVRRRFAVTWRLVRADGAWVAESLSAVKRSGPEPAAACT